MGIVYGTLVALWLNRKVRKKINIYHQVNLVMHWDAENMIKNNEHICTVITCRLPVKWNLFSMQHILCFKMPKKFTSSIPWTKYAPNGWHFIFLGSHKLWKFMPTSYITQQKSFLCFMWFMYVCNHWLHQLVGSIIICSRRLVVFMCMWITSIGLNCLLFR